MSEYKVPVTTGRKETPPMNIFKAFNKLMKSIYLTNILILLGLAFKPRKEALKTAALYFKLFAVILVVLYGHAMQKEIDRLDLRLETLQQQINTMNEDLYCQDGKSKIEAFKSEIEGMWLDHENAENEHKEWKKFYKGLFRESEN